MWKLSMHGDNDCSSQYDIFDFNDSTINCSDNAYHSGHYCFNFNYRDDNDYGNNGNGDNDKGDSNNDDNDNNDHDFSNNDFRNHNSDDDNFSLINNNINRASDNDHDSIYALDDQLDVILHCVGSQYACFFK